MDEVRLIDGNALEQEMREFAAQIFVGATEPQPTVKKPCMLARTW